MWKCDQGSSTLSCEGAGRRSGLGVLPQSFASIERRRDQGWGGMLALEWIMWHPVVCFYYSVVRLGWHQKDGRVSW